MPLRCWSVRPNVVGEVKQRLSSSDDDDDTTSAAAAYEYYVADDLEWRLLPPLLTAIRCSEPSVVARHSERPPLQSSGGGRGRQEVRWLIKRWRRAQVLES